MVSIKASEIYQVGQNSQINTPQIKMGELTDYITCTLFGRRKKRARLITEIRRAGAGGGGGGEDKHDK